MITRTVLFIEGRTIVVAAGLVTAVVVSDQVLYRFLVVPRLGEWQSVPVYLWFIESLPVILAGLAGGAYLVRWIQLVTAAVLAAIATQGYISVAALLHSPGHAKSLALEAPIHFWTSWLVLVAVVFLLLLLLGSTVQRLRGPVVSV